MATFDAMKYIRPNYLLFEGVTNEKGRLNLNFEPKQLNYGAQHNLAVQQVTIDTDSIYNVDENQEEFILIDTHGTWSHLFLSRCKIVYVKDLINFMMDANVPISYDGNGNLQIDLNYGTMTMSARIARLLGLVNIKGDISSLIQKMNEDAATIYFESGTGRVGLSATGKVQMLPVKLMVNLEKNIWNEVSDKSFQSVFIYSDLVERQFVGSQTVQILSNIPFDETKRLLNYQFSNLQWRNVVKSNTSTASIQLADSVGRFLKNVKCTVLVKVMRKYLF